MNGTSLESILQQVAQLPLSEQQLLKQLLNDRNAPAVFPAKPELSMTQAAELLNVSVGFVEKLLASGELPQRTAASGQPTIKLADLLAYKKRSDEEAAAILDELTAQAQELKWGMSSCARIDRHLRCLRSLIMRRRLPAPGLSFISPNLPFLIAEIEQELLNVTAP